MKFDIWAFFENPPGKTQVSLKSDTKFTLHEDQSTF